MKAVAVHKQLIERFNDTVEYRNDLAINYLMVNRYSIFIQEQLSLLSIFHFFSIHTIGHNFAFFRMSWGFVIAESWWGYANLFQHFQLPMISSFLWINSSKFDLPNAFSKFGMPLKCLHSPIFQVERCRTNTPGYTEHLAGRSSCPVSLWAGAEVGRQNWGKHPAFAPRPILRSSWHERLPSLLPSWWRPVQVWTESWSNEGAG